MQNIQIPENHPCFSGHFPGTPILPGVLILDRVIALAEQQLAHPLEKYEFQNVKFLAVVAPKEYLKLNFLAASTSGDYKFTVHILKNNSLDEVLACTGLLRTKVAERV